MNPIRCLLAASLALVVGCSDAPDSKRKPLFRNSVVSNDLEFIRTGDKGAFSCLSYVGTFDEVEMPDRRRDELFADGVHGWTARYTDGTSVDFAAHPDFGSRSAAFASVEPVAKAVGELPTFMRSTLSHVVVHKGNETAFAEDKGHFFVVYSNNIRTRIRNHDIEETVFHESVHATLDARYSDSREWRAAQRADGAFVTNYAADNPDGEDLAESALFAWATIVHPGRLPEDVEARVREIMPNRLAFFEKLFERPLFRSVGAAKGC